RLADVVSSHDDGVTADVEVEISNSRIVRNSDAANSHDAYPGFPVVRHDVASHSAGAPSAVNDPISANYCLRAEAKSRVYRARDVRGGSAVLGSRACGRARPPSVSISGGARSPSEGGGVLPGRCPGFGE